MILLLNIHFQMHPIFPEQSQMLSSFIHFQMPPIFPEQFQDEFEYEKKLLEEEMLREVERPEDEEPDWFIVDSTYKIGTLD